MMTKKESYTKELRKLSRWDDYLLANSNLPGPRANLELMQAFIEVGNEATFVRYTEKSPLQAPVDSPDEFLAFCGTAGLGRLIAKGQVRHFDRLKKLASDPRWRIREAVAWAIELAGENNFEDTLERTIEWAMGNFLEQQALVAGLSRPSLLKSTMNAIKILAVLDHVTRSILEVPERESEEFNTLRQGLGYCWSVVIAAHPEAGKPVFKELLTADDPDIRRIMKENLKKDRLKKMDEKWVENLLHNIK